MFLKLFIFVATVGLASTADSNPVVTVTQGALQGAWKASAKGREYASFQGVPYAIPPTGEYRFKEPQELTSWDGTWNATEPLSACLQYDPFSDSITGNEDCLYLNIHTPNISSDASLPVMVFIHGGAFMYGEGSVYDPIYFMDYDMVVITFNYRLGPLGFLSTADDVIPGNNGLKDQSFALHWVKNNIKMFGGNPDSITLTGCSAGGASVHYHYLSQLSRDTFHRGIAFSGSAFDPWAFAVKPVQNANTLASIVGCSSDTSTEILNCLMDASAEDIVNAQNEMFDWKVKLFSHFTPTIEAAEVEDAFLNKYPYQAAVDGDMLNVPLITAMNAQEGLYPGAADLIYLDEIESQWSVVARDLFKYNDTLSSTLWSDVAAKIKEEYFGDETVSEDTFSQLVEALTDRLFIMDIGRLAEIHALKSGQATYVYKYSYRATTSLSNLLANNEEDYGVCHCDDVLHIFNYPYIDARTDTDLQMIYNLCEMIYTYASTGTPVMAGSDIEWLPVTSGDSEINYLEIFSPNSTEMKSSSDFGRRSFWDNLGIIENKNYNATLIAEL
uniref:Carboxylic ester hydrolase n=1 Tax=Antheraea polyphemus TaxID=7120 RepID=Q2TIL4_ANTPO|nr:pheromone-degrading enzyme 2 [Antheraea polyphemus]